MRLDAVRQWIRKNRISSAVFVNTLHAKDSFIRYLSGFEVERAVMIVSQNSARLYVPEFELSRARKESRINAFPLQKKIAWNKLLGKGAIGVRKDCLPIAVLEEIRKSAKAKTADISQMCVEIRSVKNPEEIRRIRKACDITDRAFAETLSSWKNFRTELDAAEFIKKSIRERGGELAFEPIVASGRNAAFPHHKPGNARLAKGFCIIDMGAKYRGYCSDFTRTIFLGEAGGKHRDVYAMLVRAQEQAIGEVKSNVNFKEVEKQIRIRLGRQARYFTHGLGHGLGTEIHEDIPVPLKKNMVITVEPGIYVHNKLGIRIEDTVAVSDKGAVCLTRFPKRLIQVKV